MSTSYADIENKLHTKEERLFLDNCPFSGVLVKYVDSIKQEKNYVQGKLHGLQKSYFKNGELSTITLYTNGNQNGRRIEYYECGSKKLNANYTQGDLDGIFEEWSTDGLLVMRKTFYKGKLIAIKNT